MPGIIGTGLLGQALVSRMLAADLDVVGWDIDPVRLQELADKGARPARAIEEIAPLSTIILCLPDSQIVGQVIQQLEQLVLPGSLIIDTTTGHPDDSRRIARRLEQVQVSYLDATVAGSSLQVEAGDGLLMVGGRREVYDDSQQLLGVLAGRHEYLGPSGAGATAKLIVNLALGLNRAVLAETLALAEAAGMDQLKILEVLKNSAAYSAQMDSKGHKMIARDYELQARLSQHLKDVELILELGQHSKCPLPLSEQHRTLLERAVQQGLADQDNSAIREVWNKPTGL